VPTSNRSAGRIEDELWLPFLETARELGMTNTGAMREALADWVEKHGRPRPVGSSRAGPHIRD
jgi:hypothetical protein